MAVALPGWARAVVPYLPAGWTLHTEENPMDASIRVVLWRDVNLASLIRAPNVGRSFVAILEDALFGTAERWRGGQAMPDHYWAS